MTAPANKTFGIWLRALCFLALGVTLLVFALRTFYTFDFLQPRYFVTSGAEEESLYAVWKYVHGQPVYVDFHKMPFAASYFNWAYYLFYGSVTKMVLAAFGLGEEWIPAIGRILTLLGCLAGVFFSVKIMRHILGSAAAGLRQWAMLLFFFGGYIMGFWAVTVRPDVWALALELGGLFFFLRFLQNSNWLALLSAVLLFYLAWSFKQNFIGLLGGCVLCLLLQKRFAAAAVLSLSFGTLATATYLLGSDDYRYLLFQSQLRMKISASLGLANFRLAFIKSLPITLFALALCAALLRKFPVKKMGIAVWNDAVGLCLACCFAVSFPLFFFMAMKEGASDNYFFTPFVSLAFLNIYALRLLPYTSSTHSLAGWGFALACLLTAGEGCLILAQKFGRINLRPLSGTYETAKRLMDTLPKPVLFENDNIANLPWVNRSAENFILATTYYYKRDYGDKFERGGVEGLMEEGYFGAIVTEGINGDYKHRYRLADSLFEGPRRYYVWRKD